jgi:hypothetical protein
MPYINQAIRESLNDGRKATKGGELNYQFSKLLNDFIAMRGLSYSVINEFIGALECAKLEAYRRVAAPYEDKKIGENGEVFTCL